MDELAKGGVAVAEALGGVRLGEAVEKDGAERLVLALGGTRGLLEKVLAARVVHNGGVPSVSRLLLREGSKLADGRKRRQEKTRRGERAEVEKTRP